MLAVSSNRATGVALFTGKTVAKPISRRRVCNAVCGDFSSRSPIDMPRSEVARKYFRTVYDFPNWQQHRNSTRFLDRLLQLPRSHILMNCLPIVSWVTAVATALLYYTKAYAAKTLPSWAPNVIPSAFASTFIAQTSVALSLLLVFRTNSAYARWDEARKLWGMFLNRSRDLSRQAVTLFPTEYQETKQTFCRWIIACARILRLHFQPDAKVEDELKDCLNQEEIDMVVKSSHRPVTAMHVLSQLVQQVPFPDIHQFQMSQNLTAYQDVLGGCERILRAPIPVSYTRHTARFLFLWLTLLPFALLPSCGVATIPVSAVITGVLAGIEEIGVQIEEPFGVLPLSVIVKRVENDVKATLKDDTAVKKLVQNASFESQAAVAALN